MSDVEKSNNVELSLEQALEQAKSILQDTLGLTTPQKDATIIKVASLFSEAIKGKVYLSLGVIDALQSLINHLEKTGDPALRDFRLVYNILSYASARSRATKNQTWE